MLGGLPLPHKRKTDLQATLRGSVGNADRLCMTCSRYKLYINTRDDGVAEEHKFGVGSEGR